MACAMKSVQLQRSGLAQKVQKQCSVKPVARGRTVTKAISDVNLIVSGCTAGALALGRFGVLPLHKAYLAKAGLPKQDGKTHADAGDLRSVEQSLAVKTNDPEGFTIVMVAAWGALGHAAAYYLLATQSLTSAGITRNPF